MSPEPHTCGAYKHKSRGTRRSFTSLLGWQRYKHFSAEKIVFYHMVRVILAPSRQRQVDCWVQGQPGLHRKLQDSQGYIEKPCLEKPKRKFKRTFVAPLAFIATETHLTSESTLMGQRHSPNPRLHLTGHRAHPEAQGVIRAGSHRKLGCWVQPQLLASFPICGTNASINNLLRNIFQIPKRP